MISKATTTCRAISTWTMTTPIASGWRTVYFNDYAELVSDNCSACQSRRGDFDVHIDMTYELKVGVEVYHAHYEDDWDDVPAGWPDWAEQLAEENEKLGEFYRDLKKDKATQEKFDFALRYSDDLSKVNWKLAMK